MTHPRRCGMADHDPMRQAKKIKRKGKTMTKNELVAHILYEFEYFNYHNKNLTKKQYQLIMDLLELCDNEWHYGNE